MADPNRLHLRRVPGSTIYIVWHKKKWIAHVDSVPCMTEQGMMPPAIMLRRRCTEQVLSRIKDLVNKRDGTNRDIQVVPPPPGIEHPAIQKYLLRQRMKW